jgi:hypothetical protein
MYATTTSVFTSESSLTSWWETTVWIVSERHWPVLGGSHEILNSTFLVKVKLTSISYAACSNTCTYNNTMVESLKKKTFCSRQDCIFR